MKKHVRPRSGKRSGKHTLASNFAKFLFQKEQIKDLIIFGILYFAVFIAVKLMFKFPMTDPDTGNYVYASILIQTTGYRPVGYSWFLEWLYTLSTSIHMIFIFQYLLFAISGIYFIFTIKYFFSPRNYWMYLIFSLFIVLSPTATYLSNFILSDSLFLSLTMLWITSGIWLFHHIRLYTLITHILFLFLAINTRYVGLFYPIISVGILLFSSSSLKFRLATALLPLLVLFFSINYTKNEMEKVFHLRTFSAFSGWALANNAVSILPYIDGSAEKFKTPGLEAIHQEFISYDNAFYRQKAIMGTWFIWKETYPGKKLMIDYATTNRQTYSKAWVHMGIQYKQYGKELILRHPAKYVKHYLIPNSLNIFSYFPMPHMQSLKADKLLKQRYLLKEDTYTYPYNPAKLFNLTRFTFHHLTLILFFIGMFLIAFPFFRRGLKAQQLKILILIIIFSLAYFSMSIISHPINNYRYMMPLFAIKIMIPYIVLNRLVRLKLFSPIKDNPVLGRLLSRD